MFYRDYIGTASTPHIAINEMFKPYIEKHYGRVKNIYFVKNIDKSSVMGDIDREIDSWNVRDIMSNEMGGEIDYDLIILRNARSVEEAHMRYISVEEEKIFFFRLVDVLEIDLWFEDFGIQKLNVSNEKQNKESVGNEKMNFGKMFENLGVKGNTKDFSISLIGGSLAWKDRAYVNGEIQDVSGFTMPLDNMVFIMPVTEVAVNDVIIDKNVAKVVISVNPLQVINLETATQETVIAVTKFGFKIYSKVVSLLSGANGMEKMLPLMMLGQNGGNGGNDMVQMLMMSSLLGGGQNPFENVFGGLNSSKEVAPSGAVVDKIIESITLMNANIEKLSNKVIDLEKKD